MLDVEEADVSQIVLAFEELSAALSLSYMCLILSLSWVPHVCQHPN